MATGASAVKSDLKLFALSGLATLISTFAYAPVGAVGVTLPMVIVDPLYRINGGAAWRFGHTRYRPFELGEWAFLVLFYVTAALIYLPSRDLSWRKVLHPKRPGEHVLIQTLIDVAFKANSAARARKWVELFQTLHEPLELGPTHGVGTEVAITDDAVALVIPATTDVPAMLLRQPWRGRGLLRPRHQRSMDHLVDIMRRAEEGRRAYELGVTQEHTRIARDMHDNIGAQRLSALHSPATNRKDMMIGHALNDLCDIIRNANRPCCTQARRWLTRVRKRPSALQPQASRSTG